MDTNSSTRTLTPSRIIALVIITAVVLGLGSIRVTHDGELEVPDGARAGDLSLESCEYTTDDGSQAADCGTLVVPENREKPSSRLIALPVVRIKARSAHPAEPIFRLEGGPGITNMTFPKASRFTGHHDVVLVGYRGVDGSSPLDCPEVSSALKHSRDLLSTKTQDAYADAFQSCATRLQDDGVDLSGYTLAQRVDDMEAARTALGYDRVDLVSESAGTRTAMIYGWRHPSSIHRSVMIGVNPPGHFLWDPRTTDDQIRTYAALCAKDEGCSERTDDLAAALRRAVSHVPDRWAGLHIKEGNARIAAFYGMVESGSDAGPLSAPATIDALLSADHGDASGLWFASVMADLTFPDAFAWGDLAAAAQADAATSERYFAAGGDPGSILGNPGSQFLFAGGRLNGVWPTNANADEYTQVQDSDVETLLIGGNLDVATPPRFATEELLPHLRNGHQVVLTDLGHTNDFWTVQPDASSHLVNTFLDRGVVDDSRYRHEQVDFSPGVSQTTLAQGIAAGIAGFAVLTVVGMVWMPVRVRRRGRFGPKTGVVLRSLGAAVLGLGGWLTGALVVLAALPGVPLDDALLGVLSVGIPVGLTVYWGWVRRDDPVGARTIGAAAAVLGGLAGAWMGIGATSGVLAVLTAIAGAVAVANLALLAVDLLGLGRTAPDGTTVSVPPVPAPAREPELAGRT